jgi:hypothetical protein
MSWPRFSPATWSRRVWLPLKMRLALASCAASEKLTNLRSTPGRAGEVTVKAKSLP